MLRLENITKSFSSSQGAFNVIADISLEVNNGELLCIIGPTGSGKSTLLQLMAGFIHPTNGTVSIDGKLVQKPGPEVVLMFQNYALFPWLTVYGNVLFGLSARELSLDVKHELVDQHLKLVGLHKFASWFPYQLSGGMQQRVALARALVGQPKVLLMDEPFSSVDAQYREYLRQSLVDLWQKTGTTIVFVTHSIIEAVYLGGRVIVLSKGPASIREVLPVSLPYPRDKYDQPFISVSQRLESLLEKPDQDMLNQTFNHQQYVQAKK